MIGYKTLISVCPFFLLLFYCFVVVLRREPNGDRSGEAPGAYRSAGNPKADDSVLICVVGIVRSDVAVRGQSDCLEVVGTGVRM